MLKKLFYSAIAALLLLPGIVFADTVVKPSQGGTGLSTYSLGDILYSATANPFTLSKLHIGSNGQCLGVVLGLPGWLTCASGGGGLATSTNPLMATYFVATGTTPSGFNDVTVNGTLTLNGILRATIINFNDTEANLSGVVASSSQFAYATDSGNIYMGDGVTTIGNLNAINGFKRTHAGIISPTTSGDKLQFGGTNPFIDGGVISVTTAQPYALVFSNSAGTIAGICGAQSEGYGCYAQGNNAGLYGQSNGEAGIGAGVIGNGTYDFYANPGGAGTWGFYQLPSGAKNYFGDKVGIGTTSPYAPLSVVGEAVASFFTATTSTKSTLPYASTTAITTTNLYATRLSNLTSNGFVKTSSADGTLSIDTNSYLLANSTDWNKQTNYAVLTLTPTTTIPVWIKDQLFASSSAIIAGDVRASTFTATSTTATSTLPILKAGSATAYWELSTTNLLGTDYPSIRAHAADGSIVGINRGNLYMSEETPNSNVGFTMLSNDATLSSSINFNTTSQNLEITPYQSTTFVNNVAIGTTSLPNIFNLDVSGTRPNLAITDNSAASGNKHWLISNEGGNLYFGTSTDKFSTSTIPAVSFLKNGQVSIGSSTPWGMFSINHNFNAPAIPIIAVASTTAGGVINPLLTLLNNGFFGIGTAAPTNPLTIVGNANMTTGSLTLSTGGITANGTSAFGSNLIVGSGSAVSSGFSDSGVEIRAGNTAKILKTLLQYNINTSATAGSAQTFYLTNASSVSSEAVRVSAYKTSTWTSGDEDAAYAVGVSNNGVYATSTTITNMGLGVGTTSPFAGLSAQAPWGASTVAFAVSSSTAANGSTGAVRFRIDNNGQIFAPSLTSVTGGTNRPACYVAATGELVDDTTSVCQVSSERYKHDIKPLTVPALDMVNALKTVSYSPNDNALYDFNNTQYGFTAEQVAKIDPHLSEYGQDGKPRTLDDRAILSVIVKSIQELSARTGVTKMARSAEENWQWIVMVLLVCGFIYQQIQINKIKNKI